MSTGLERLIEASKGNVDISEPEHSSEELPDDLEDSLELLIEQDNPMADAAEKALKRL